MSTRQIKLYTSELGSQKKQTTTLGYVNPEADGATMLAFAKKMNAFTTNTYNTTDLVETYNLDTETPPVTPTPKQTATITLNPNTFTKQNVSTGNATAMVTITSDYEGTPLVSTSNSYTVEYYTDPIRLNFTGSGGNEILTVMIPETQNYTAAVATITIAN